MKDAGDMACLLATRSERGQGDQDGWFSKKVCKQDSIEGEIRVAGARDASIRHVGVVRHSGFARCATAAESDGGE